MNITKVNLLIITKWSAHIHAQHYFISLSLSSLSGGTVEAEDYVVAFSGMGSKPRLSATLVSVSQSPVEQRRQNGR